MRSNIVIPIEALEPTIEEFEAALEAAEKIFLAVLSLLPEEAHPPATG